MKFILNDIDPADFVLAGRAVRWLRDRPKQKDAILQYGEIGQGLTLYVCRRIASISVTNVTQPKKMEVNENG